MSLKTIPYNLLKTISGQNIFSRGTGAIFSRGIQSEVIPQCCHIPDPILVTSPGAAVSRSQPQGSLPEGVELVKLQHHRLS